MDSSTEQRLKVEFPHASANQIRSLLQSGSDLEACRAALNSSRCRPPSSQPNLLGGGGGGGQLTLDTENLPLDSEMQRYLQPHSPLPNCSSNNNNSPHGFVAVQFPVQPPPASAGRSPVPSSAAAAATAESAHLSLQRKRLNQLQCRRHSSAQQLLQLQSDLAIRRDLLQSLLTCNRNQNHHAGASDCCFDVLVNELRFELRRTCPPPPSLNTSAGASPQPPPLPPPRRQQTPSSIASPSPAVSNASSPAGQSPTAGDRQQQQQQQQRYLHQVSSPASTQQPVRPSPGTITARSAPQTPVVQPHVFQNRQHQSIAEDESAAANWQCHKCTFENHPDLKECEICGTLRAPPAGHHPFCIGAGCVCGASGSPGENDGGQQRVGQQPH